MPFSERLQLCCSWEIITLNCILTDPVAFSSAHFGVGTGPIHLDNMGCSGSESSLLDCQRSSSVSCFRGHIEDAGVRCQGMQYIYILGIRIRIIASRARRGRMRSLAMCLRDL